jgi:choice-of-anchor B domain-containing protein
MQKRPQTVIPALLAVCCSYLSLHSPAIAHSEADEPRYVAESGKDLGRCDDPAAPCQTIAYALSQLGKGGRLQIAAGSYDITDPNDVFYLVSGVVSISGGYDADTNFARAGNAGTILRGVPAQYRAQLNSRGFHVIADRKGRRDDELLVESQKMLGILEDSQKSLAAAPCANGLSGGLDCVNAELLSRFSNNSVSAAPARTADIWGFTDLNSNREYAIVGYGTGTGVFDVTDPENPAEIGFIDGQSTFWRDIKVYQYFNAAEDRWNAYAYIVADSTTDGLFVIDLTELPHRVFQSSAFTDTFLAAHNVFITNIDYGTGLALDHAEPSLIVAGANSGGGNFRSYSLANPASPQQVSVASGSGLYMHDAASTIITDSRRTQCQNETPDYCEVLFDFNEFSLVAWDITNPATPVLLDEVAYSGLGYTHSGWPTEDSQHLFVHDETDEGTSNNTRVRVFSLASLTNLSLAATWQSNNITTDHNGFVLGNRYYMSNYKRGLTILDISDPVNPDEAGYLDTYGLSDTNGSVFQGAWGAYPYFQSGSIAVSDVGSGLHMIRDTSLDVAEGSLSFTASSFGVVEGNNLAVTVQRSGGTNGAVSVDYSIVPGTADGSDASGTSGTLNWPAGDGTDKTITLAALADGDATEGLERMLIRLYSPRGGATLTPAHTASVYISEGNTAEIEFDRATIDIAERGFAKAVVVFQRNENANGPSSVDYSVTGGDATANADYQGASTGTINWAAGDADPKWIEFDIVDDGAGEADEFFELSLANASGANIGTNNTVRVNILDGAGANQAPVASAGGSQTVQANANVTLNGDGSRDPDGDALTYSWVQTMGPNVALQNADAAVASFTAPDVTSDTLLRFELSVSDPGGLTAIATANVTVSNNTGSNGFGSSGGGGSSSYLLLLLALVASRARLIRMGAAE